MTQNLSELQTKILNCVHYSPHSMSVKPTQAIELIAYILAIQAQPTPSQSVEFEEHSQYGIDGVYKDLPIGTKLYIQLSKPQPTSQDAIDAERYRWLRIAKSFQIDLVTYCFEQGLDDEIDKAMKESK